MTNTTESNVLYFEGAGMDFYEEASKKASDVGNFRIRTSFKNNDGEQYYIELGNAVRLDKKFKAIPGVMGMRIDHLFKVADRHKEELNLGGYEIKTDHTVLRELDYTCENITKWVNENLNCSFDAIEVLDDMHGYRVHADNGGYKLMEEAEIIPERAKARREAYEKVDAEYRKHTGSKYSVIGMLGMDSDSITVRCHASSEAVGNKPRVKQVKVSYA